MSSSSRDAPSRPHPESWPETAGPGADDAEPDAALVKYVTGEAAVPVPTYFIGGYGEQCRDGVGQGSSWDSQPM